MNNKLFVWVIIAIVAFGGVWYLLAPSLGVPGVTSPSATTTPMVATTSTPKTVTKSPVNTTPKPTKVTAKTVGIGSLSFLLALKQPLVCTVKTVSGYARSGTLYVAGGQARANFVSTSMIDDGTYLYVWTKGASTGLKLLAASGASGSAIASNGGVDLSTDLSYACNPWTVDASVFAPPTSVSF